jgi:protein-S-isoprenylcysteine O-methyltransferase Ste14
MQPLALEQKRKMAGGARVARKFLTITLVCFVVACLHPAAAQVVIPHGDFDSDFEKYLVATISFVLLCLAAWQFYRNRR